MPESYALDAGYLPMGKVTVDKCFKKLEKAISQQKVPVVEND